MIARDCLVVFLRGPQYKNTFQLRRVMVHEVMHTLKTLTKSITQETLSASNLHSSSLHLLQNYPYLFTL